MTNKHINIIHDNKGKWVQTYTHNQTRFIEAIDEYKIVFAEGAAGCGKTFLSIAKAVELLKRPESKFEKLILTRPVVESGEKLGFLPGTKEEKLEPYLVPLQDSIDIILKKDDKLREKIKIFPLAYLRGVTFTNSIVILDESQNTTKSQMKLFLTRIGKNSKLIINGDVTQSDIGFNNGLEDILYRIETTNQKISKEIRYIDFDDNDIVRDPVVKDILELYENNSDDEFEEDID